MANSEWGYNCEDAAYEALSEGGTQLYRFYNAEKGYHFLTTSEEEANNVIDKSVGEQHDLITGQVRTFKLATMAGVTPTKVSPGTPCRSFLKAFIQGPATCGAF